MPGFTHDRYCKHKENCFPGDLAENAYRGKCGGCRGECQPCDGDGDNCGEWQDCDCQGAPACGDGHNCKKYIDITFTLKEFVIQGQTCCSGDPPLTQPCDGAMQNNETPVIGAPSGWTNITGGVQDPVSYAETTHHVRLTRAGSDKPYCSGGGDSGEGTSKTICRCFWGGYWTSSCDCSNCCCHEESDTYPDCDCEHVGDPTEAVVCGGPTAACDPENPCVPMNDGFASSLDVWGLHSPMEHGGSDGQAFCVDQVPASPPCPGMVSSACDSFDDVSYACWSCGSFKPHHIEAYMTIKTDPGSCDSAWQLEIRGLTEQARSVMGHQGDGFDCIQPFDDDDCYLAAGGGSAAALAYRGVWWGATSICNSNCDNDTQDGQPELSAHGCSCPPLTSFDSTVRTDGALVSLHPTAIFGGPTLPGHTPGEGTVHTCMVPSSYCGSTEWLFEHPNTPEVDGEYYGPPAIWWCRCNYCDDCCNTDWDTGCVDCDDCDPCNCCGPNEHLDTNGIPNPLYPCQHCLSEPDLNHADCQPCPGGGLQAHMCADVSISMIPNNNPLPTWALA